MSSLGQTDFSKAEIKAKVPVTTVPDQQQKIEKIYIGVFFDGTSNNAVRTAKSAEVKRTKVNLEKLRTELQKAKNGKERELIRNKIENERKTLYKYANKSKEELVIENLTPDIQPVQTDAFSNISILYSIYNEQQENNSSTDKASIVHKIYVEGSGAIDISRSFLDTITKVIANEDFLNPDGLGMGLGNTGVTALVSKAVMYCQLYIESLSVTNKQEVEIHFDVFGFSRGAACARLFSYLVTRGKNGILGIREKEFGEHYASSRYNKKENRLAFLDEYDHKDVDFLGIYDTVVSIGFLKQIRKENWVDPWSKAYTSKLNKIAKNYKENWHYKNVSEYGMYISDEVKCCHICAMDEFRENFAITDVGITPPKNCMEIFIPGCHCDVGGGYYDGEEEQEIQLYRTNRYTIIKEHTGIKDKEINFKIIVNNPQNYTPNNTYNEDVKPINLDTFGKLRWIDPIDDSGKTVDKTITIKTDDGGPDFIINRYKEYQYSSQTKINVMEKNVPCTMRAVESDVDDVIQFKRNVKAGYSNIPLAMMIKAATEIGECKRLPELPKEGGKEAPPAPAYAIPKDLTTLGKSMVEQVGSLGQRKFLYPGGGYSSPEYRDLRLKYLHFSSVMNPDSTKNYAHKSLSTGANESRLANIANFPNIDEHGIMCRIVYHGDNVCPVMYAEGEENPLKHLLLNYMYEYHPKKEDVINVQY